MIPVIGPRADLLLACAVLLSSAACSARERAGFGDPPPQVDVADAAEYAGRTVEVRGRVVAAEATKGRALLELEGDDAGSLRVVIAPPLLGPRPADLVAKLQGEEVVAAGAIDDLGDRLEMLVGDPADVRLASEAASVPPELPAELPPEPTAPARSAPVPREAPSGRGDAARESAPGAAASAGAESSCDRARARWRKASEEAQAPLARLQSCLAQTAPSCRREVEAARVAMAEVAAAEERVSWLCPQGR